MGSHGATLAEQLGNFSQALGRAWGASLPPAPPPSWQAAFVQLIAYLEGLPAPRRKHVVFLDELPWLAARRSRFLTAFEHFWNSWAVKKPWLVVVVCGSAAAWMTGKLLHARGGLHNRITRQIRLEPFDLRETRQLLKSRGIELSSYQLLGSTSPSAVCLTTSSRCSVGKHPLSASTASALPRMDCSTTSSRASMPRSSTTPAITRRSSGPWVSAAGG